MIPHHSIFSSKTWAHIRTPKEVTPRIDFHATLGLNLITRQRTPGGLPEKVGTHMRKTLITFCDMIWPVVRIAPFVLEDVIEWPEEYTFERFRRLGHGIFVHKPSYTFRLDVFHSLFQSVDIIKFFIHSQFAVWPRTQRYFIAS